MTMQTLSSTRDYLAEVLPEGGKKAQEGLKALGQSGRKLFGRALNWGKSVSSKIGEEVAKRGRRWWKTVKRRGIFGGGGKCDVMMGRFTLSVPIRSGCDRPDSGCARISTTFRGSSSS